MKTVLSLEVSDNPNSKIMRLFDTSHYYSDESIDNYIIEVLPANRSTWVNFNVAKGFSLTLNSSSMLYRKVSDISGLIAIPDGIYEIKQSIKPNVFTVVHYLHLRTTALSNKVKDKMIQLLCDKCNITRAEFYENRNKLRDIEDYIKAAKWKVEECGDKKKGKELYEFATKLLETYSNECRC